MPKKTDSPSPKRAEARRIVCVETGEAFESAETAAKSAGIGYGGSNIRTAAYKGGVIKGSHWCFEDEPEAKPGETCSGVLAHSTGILA